MRGVPECAASLCSESKFKTIQLIRVDCFHEVLSGLFGSGHVKLLLNKNHGGDWPDSDQKPLKKSCMLALLLFGLIGLFNFVDGLNGCQLRDLLTNRRQDKKTSELVSAPD